MQEKKKEKGIRELSCIPETPDPFTGGSQVRFSLQRAVVLQLSEGISGSAEPRCRQGGVAGAL